MQGFPTSNYRLVLPQHTGLGAQETHQSRKAGGSWGAQGTHCSKKDRVQLGCTGKTLEQEGRMQMPVQRQDAAQTLHGHVMEKVHLGHLGPNILYKVNAQGTYWSRKVGATGVYREHT